MQGRRTNAGCCEGIVSRQAGVWGGRSYEVLVLVQARAGVASELGEEGAMDSGKVLFRGTNGWRRFVEDRIDAQKCSGFSDYVGVGGFHCVTE